MAIKKIKRKLEVPVDAPTLVVPEVVPEKYSVFVNMGGVKARTTGTSIYEALTKIKMDKVVGKVQMTFSNGVKTHTMVFIRPIFFKRLLVNNAVKQIMEKRAKAFLGEK